VGKVVLCRNSRQEDLGRNALEHGAAGLLLLTDPDVRPMDRIGTNREVWVPVPIPSFCVSPAVAQDLLAGSGLALDDLTIRFAALPLSTTARLEVSLDTDEAAQGRNVLGVLPGRDPKYADEVVILGGHYDHLGQDPDGTAWVGANDNASGAATVLEIARSWQEQGYVPRRTVLFAAWDAEEMGLLGSQYYVGHPRYPLTRTVAMLNLDMVGAGEDTLHVDGSGPLARSLTAIASSLGITATISDGGRSDHASFSAARVPASMLIWFGPSGGDTVTHYHRPADTPAVIEPHKLGGAGRIANLALLALAEAEPEISDILAARAAAAAQGDLNAFLQTSTLHLRDADAHWFADLQALSPTRFEMETTDLWVVGRVATATVRMTLEYAPGEDKEDRKETRTGSLPVRLEHGDEGWRWGGPALVWQPPGEGFVVAHPVGKAVAAAGLGPLAATEYARLAARLGLPPEARAAILLYPDSRALRADTAFSLASDVDAWVGACAAMLDGGWEGASCVKLISSTEISRSQTLTDSLAHLALVEAGVGEEIAPWLWRGLPLALRAEADPVAVQSKYLQALDVALSSDASLPADVTGWAAVDFLRRQVGWEGIGRLVAAIGQGSSVDDALHATIGTDAEGFEAAWQADWERRLRQAGEGLASLMQARQDAVVAGDEGAFLHTVDPSDPTLLAEERGWFADLSPHPPETFALENERLLALLDDGRLLAKVNMRYRLAGEEGARETKMLLTVLLRPYGSGYRWAGPALEPLQGDRVVVLYPEGQETLASTLLAEAEAAHPQIAADLAFEPPNPLAVKTYSDARVFRTSVFLSLPEWVEGWTGPGESVKLVTQSQQTPADQRRALVQGMAEQFLWQMGVGVNWLREGLAAYEVGRLNRADAQHLAAHNLPQVIRAAEKDQLFPLAEGVDFYQLPEKEAAQARAQAWDVVRHLAETHGWEKVLALVGELGRGLSLEDAFSTATGQTLAEFEAAWRESVARAHARPEWATAARQFDPEATQGHMTELAGPAYGGRLAGSPGSQAAAGYIAQKFAAYGLTPAGDGGTFFQQVPISYTAMTSAPRLVLLDQEGKTLDELEYRQDFVALFEGAAGRGSVEGDLVWVREDDYGDMSLNGKVALRRLEGTVEEEVARAIEHGASGLILTGQRKGRQLLAKEPLPVTMPLTLTIPVLEVSPDGLKRLLAAGGSSLVEASTSPPALPLDVQVYLDVPLTPAEAASTANVLGLWPGSDPSLSHEVLIVGAHYDHVGHDPDGLFCPPGLDPQDDTGCTRREGLKYPGANDDASGVAVLLEIARLWQEAGYRPARSVLFAAWGAQEPGEVGSSFYVAHPAFPLTDTVAMLQLDAVGGSRTGYYLQAQGDRKVEGENLLLFTIEAAASQVEGRLDLARPTGRSDERPFREANVPALLLIWKGADERNLPAEEADPIDPLRLRTTGRTVALTLMMLAR